MDQLKIRQWLLKYRYVLVVLLIGVALMLIPGHQENTAAHVDVPTEGDDMESRLELILSRIDGAGEVAVMLTEYSGEEIIYQTDGDGKNTVLVTDSARNEQALIRTREPPVYRGAIVVCAGADSAAVRLAVVEAVSNVTGLGSDRITVLKME